MPLQTVLFPGQLLPLNIFETRYQTMIQTILAQQSSGFGVVLIRQGSEVGETAEPFDVGTIATIKQIDNLTDGRMNLICVGGDRFRIQTLDDSKAYLTARAEVWPWAQNPEIDLSSLIDNLKASLIEYLQILTNLVGARLEIPYVPDDPITLTSLAGFALRIPNREKQALLTTPSINEFMGDTLQVLTREISSLRSTASIPDVPDEPAQSYTPN
ncbi:MAG TPA: LON peptidase substrate-binding domain-containing protein [Anaerolineaceae bacterium]|nr:LON peptidase substrate-binding domain-containing protein [Anaerolineaceae bacterium]